MGAKSIRRLRLAGFAVMISIATSLSGCSSNKHKEGAPVHHLEKGFQNPDGSRVSRGSISDWVSFFYRRIKGRTYWSKPLPPAEYLMEKKDILAGIEAVKQVDSLTWLGHAAFLVRLEGKNILTDPFLSDYATGYPPFGPERSVPPALSVDELPPIDMIIVSHNHYDHLDAPTIEALPGKEKIHVIVPLGMGAFFKDRGYTKVSELDWYQDTLEENIKITAVPAIHNSARSLFDRNEVLWAGYVLESKGKKVYFAGDTGYGAVFKEIGEKFGPINYALVPIGAYEPRVIMNVVHVNPEEAVAIAQDLKADTVVAMHWGTIKMTDEPFDEPPKRFEAAATKNSYAKDKAWVLKIGESKELE
ncbi:MAG: MBL fold metallo-hydrolase [Rhodospirillales bacterium]|nr:MBL fold metallo-hydrolase [Rhodospirillales bacterium]